MTRVQKNVLLTYFKTAVLLTMTFCLGVVLATGIGKVLNKKDVAKTPIAPENLCDVFVLKNDIGKGCEILPEHFIVVKQLKEETPRGAVKTYQQIDNRTAKTELLKGTLLLDDFFVTRISQSDQSGYIPPGYHSVTVQVYETENDSENSIRSMRPGDQVDIVVVQNDPETGEKLDEILLLKKIPVLELVVIDSNDISGMEKKGMVALLLSDLQKKHLQDEVKEEMKIRLRICPTSETQTTDELRPQTLQQMVNRSDFSNGPETLSQTLSRNGSYDNITVVYKNSAGQPLKPLQQNELNVKSFRDIPMESYAESIVAGVSAPAHSELLDNALPNNKLVQSRPAPRYSSYYDTTRKIDNTNVQWRDLSPRLPLVYEAPSGSQTQARGVYREGGVYFSAP